MVATLSPHLHEYTEVSQDYFQGRDVFEPCRGLCTSASPLETPGVYYSWVRLEGGSQWVEERWLGRDRPVQRVFQSCLCHLQALCPQAGDIISWPFFISKMGEDEALLLPGANKILFVKVTWDSDAQVCTGAPCSRLLMAGA